MSTAARKINEAARELNGSIESVKRAIADLEEFERFSARSAFGHTVREHREMVASLDDTIVILHELGASWMRDAEPHSDLNKELQRALQVGCKNLRVCRALCSYLATGKIDSETEEIREEVMSLCKERGEQNFTGMAPEERAAIRAVHEDSTELEAWLVAP